MSGLPWLRNFGLEILRAWALGFGRLIRMQGFSGSQTPSPEPSNPDRKPKTGSNFGSLKGFVGIHRST